MLADDIRVSGPVWPMVSLLHDDDFINQNIIILYADEEHNHFDIHMQENSAFRYLIFIFDVDLDDLAGYDIISTGGYHHSVHGDWQITVQKEHAGTQMRIWSSDVAVAGLAFKEFRLTPLGLQIEGEFENRKTAAISLALETADGKIYMGYNAPGGFRLDGNFNLLWPAETPIDVPSVTAVIVNGVRIAVE